MFKKRSGLDNSPDSASHEVVASDLNPDTTDKPDQKTGVEKTESSQDSKHGGFLGGLKNGMSSALKAVGVGAWKAKQVKNLQPNFSSEDPIDHVLALNKAGAAFGGLRNLGIYADVTKITLSQALKVTTEDDFVEILTEEKEMAGDILPSDESSSNPFCIAFDDLLSRDCPDVSKAHKPDSVIPYSA